MDKRIEKMLVIGAGAGGGMVIDDFNRNHRGAYDIVGVIDDDIAKRGSRLYGVPVLGDRYDIEIVCAEKGVDVILIAIPSLSPEEKAKILQICTNTACRIKMLPSIAEILEIGSVNQSVRNVDIEDLLAREPVRLNNARITDCIRGKTVLVTGGGGSIGSELCRQIARHNPEKIIIFDIYENSVYDLLNEFSSRAGHVGIEAIIGSVRDKERLSKIFSRYRPNIVFHAAAHKHVPLMEANPSQAVLNNVFGTMNAANCAKKYGAEKFILISTDKAVNPTNVMGATKRLCELVIQSMSHDSNTEFAAVRFGNVLGSNGSVIPLFNKQIRNGGPVTLTHRDITRYFMTISEAAQLVLEAATYASGGEIYVLDMGKPVKIYDLAVNLIKLSGLEPYKDIDIKIIGLRSGEKLYEELLMSEEGLATTQNNKIFIAKPVDVDKAEFEKGLLRLGHAAVMQDNTTIRRVLKEMVGNYTYCCEDEASHSYAYEDEVVNIEDIKKDYLLKHLDII